MTDTTHEVKPDTMRPTAEERAAFNAARERGPSNHWGLGPLAVGEEQEHRYSRLVEARDTAALALDRVEAIRLRCLRPEGPVEMPPIVWWGE